MPTLRIGLSLLTLLGAGCAAAGAPRSDAPLPDKFRLADGTLVVCRMERPTGSNIPEQVCDRVEGSSIVRKQANSELLQKPPQPAVKGN